MNASMDPQAARCSLGNMSAWCLAGVRSKTLRAQHAATIAALCRVGKRDLLTGAKVPKAAIKRAIIAMQPKGLTAPEWDSVEVRAESFVKFFQRNREWVRAQAVERAPS